MKVDVQYQLSIPIIMIRHTGPYEAIGDKFATLWTWIEANDVPATRSIGIYYDNPEFTPANQLRSAACAEAPASFLPDNLPAGFEFGSIQAGNYAQTQHVGPYEDLVRVWPAFIAQVEGAMGHKILADVPAYEVYVNDPESTPPAQLVTDLFVPVK